MSKKISLPLIAAALILSFALIYISKQQTGLVLPSIFPPNNTTTEPIVVDPIVSDSKSLPLLGDPNAPVLVEVYSDYQCAMCYRFYLESIKQLISEYVNTGKVKLQYREFAFGGDPSILAAEAARCADDQDKFLEYHEQIFTSRKNQVADLFTSESLKKMAGSLGLNQATFDNCLDTNKYKNIVLSELALGEQKKINGTPTTYINGKPFVNENGEELGAVPYEMLKAQIDIALK